MSDNNKVVLGIFQTRSEVERAIDSLKSEGFSTSDISVLMPDSKGSQELAHSKGTKAPEGATTGAGAGAAIGGTLGLLVGIGALAIPGVGPFIAAGPIMATLAGAGVGGTVGGIGGALIGLGIPEYEAKRYADYVNDGGILFSVHTQSSDEMSRAKKCIEKSGAKDISSTGEVKSGKDQKSKKVPSDNPGRTDGEYSSSGHTVGGLQTPGGAHTPGQHSPGHRAGATKNTRFDGSI